MVIAVSSPAAAATVPAVPVPSTARARTRATVVRTGRGDNLESSIWRKPLHECERGEHCQPEAECCMTAAAGGPLREGDGAEFQTEFCPEWVRTPERSRTV